MTKGQKVDFDGELLLDMTDDQRELVGRVKRVVVEKVAPLVAQGEREEDFSGGIIVAFREAGLFGGTIPVEHGGLGWDLKTHMLVMEEASKVSQVLGGCLAEPSGPVGKGLMTFATEEQKDRWLRPLASGEVLAGYGLTEPHSGTDAANVLTSAHRVAGGYELNGSKRWIDWAGIGDFFLVFARTDPGSSRSRGVTAFVVERGTPGFTTKTLRGKVGLRPLRVGELIFDGCVVPEDHVIGEVGRGFRVAMSALEETRLQIAARICGGLQACLDEALVRTEGRELFGRRLADFQMTQSKVADMVVSVQVSRLLTYYAASLKRADRPATEAILAAKLYSQEAYMRASHDAVHLWGAEGILDESMVCRHFRDAKVTELTGGSNEILRVMLAERASAWRQAESLRAEEGA